jgi:hypothetical protein
MCLIKECILQWGTNKRCKQKMELWTEFF